MVATFLPRLAGACLASQYPPNSRHSPPVLRRIKVTFLNTVVRVEHALGEEDQRVAVEVRVQR